MIVCDASFLIALLDRGDAHHGRAVELAAAHGEEPLAVSVITAAEVLVAPGREDRLRVMEQALEIDICPVDESSSLRLAGLRSDTGLKMPDCCVLALAERAGARIATMDLKLARAAGRLNLATI